ncbi:MAG: hypothetical protein C3F11_17345 [Methylocystaceae bacterium]|nr:MAG: hypothetical protein C3F11_17345 [Methylocystaceae bacterium]
MAISSAVDPSPLARIAADLAALGYFPLPLAPKTKLPFQEGWNIWSDWRAGDFDRAGLVGLRNGDGGLFAIDVDFDDDSIVPALRWEFLDSPCRIGKRGFMLYCRWADGLSRRGHDIIWMNSDGREAPIQIKARGQCAVFGRHPDTGLLYVWNGDSAVPTTPLAALPTVESMDVLLERIDGVMSRFGFRRSRVVERADSAGDCRPAADATFAEWEALCNWGEETLEREKLALAGMAVGSRRGTRCQGDGLRIGPLFDRARQEEIAAELRAVTGDENCGKSWLSGCAQSAGEAIARKLQSIRSGAAKLAEAKARNIVVTGFDEPPADIAPALRDRAATLGASRKSKAITTARADFARLCNALAADGVISELDSYKLGVLAKDFGHEANGKNPRLPAPDDRRLAKVVVDTAAKGGNVGLTIAAGVAVLRPPTIVDGSPLRQLSGLLPAGEETFAAVAARIAIVRRDGAALFVHRAPDGQDVIMGERDLRNMFANALVTDGERTEPAFDWWLRHERRATKSAVFKTSGDVADDEYNFWRGFAVERLEGTDRLRRFMRHLREIVCRRDRAKFKYLVKWLAWAVQHPDKNPETVVVLKGVEEGGGKSTVSDVMRKIFGKSHSAVVKKPEELLGQFNSHLEFASFVALEETLFAGNRAQADAMRSAITDGQIFVNAKFIKPYFAPNVTHAILTTNHEHAIHAGVNARRWFVVEVDEKRVGDRSYFDALHVDLEAGGYGQLLNALLEVDLGDWHPRELVRTAELAEQMAMSGDGVTQWYKAGREDGNLDFFNERGVKVAVAFGERWRTSTLYDSYLAFTKRAGGRADARDAFGKKLKRILGVGAYVKNVRELGKEGRERGYHLPELEADGADDYASPETWLRAFAG